LQRIVRKKVTNHLTTISKAIVCCRHSSQCQTTFSKTLEQLFRFSIISCRRLTNLASTYRATIYKRSACRSFPMSTVRPGVITCSLTGGNEATATWTAKFYSNGSPISIGWRRDSRGIYSLVLYIDKSFVLKTYLKITEPYLGRGI